MQINQSFKRMGKGEGAHDEGCNIHMVMWIKIMRLFAVFKTHINDSEIQIWKLLRNPRRGNWTSGEWNGGPKIFCGWFESLMKSIWAFEHCAIYWEHFQKSNWAKKVLTGFLLHLSHSGISPLIFLTKLFHPNQNAPLTLEFNYPRPSRIFSISPCKKVHIPFRD